MNKSMNKILNFLKNNFASIKNSLNGQKYYSGL